MMDEAQIEAAFSALAAELERRGLKAKLWVVGGAMIILSYHSRELTTDVDAAMNPRAQVLDAAQEVAAHLHLDGSWLNDSASAFIPQTGSERWLPGRTYGPALEIFLGDPRMVLAMKLRAAREPRDRADIEVLVRACYIRTEADGLALYQEFFPEDPIPKMGRIMLSESIEKVWAANDGLIDSEELVTGGAPADPVPRVVARTDAPSRPSHSPNKELWAWSVRGRVAHRISRGTGDELLTLCGHRLLLSDVRATKSTNRPPCNVCNARRPGS